jgi:hypothetical protein
MTKKTNRFLIDSQNVLDVLLNKNPVFLISWNMFYSEEVAEEFKNSGDGIIVQDYNFDFYGYNSHFLFEKDFVEGINQIIYDFKIKKSLNKLTIEYFQVLVDELELAKSSFELINVRNNEFHYQGGAKIIWSDGPGDNEEKTLDSLEEKFFEEIRKISEFKYEMTKELIDSLNEITISNNVSNVESTNLRKLELKLSVADIALLFRLFDEEGLINYKYQTEIYRHIASTMSTERQTNISEASVKNKFLTTDNTAIGNLNALLTNLKIQLNKLS